MRDNEVEHRFELGEGAAMVIAKYRRRGDILFIDHVETPISLRGHGRASQLMQAIVDHAQAEGLTITPVCSYAAAWLHRNVGARP